MDYTLSCMTAFSDPAAQKTLLSSIKISSSSLVDCWRHAYDVICNGLRPCGEYKINTTLHNHHLITSSARHLVFMHSFMWKCAVIPERDELGILGTSERAFPCILIDGSISKTKSLINFHVDWVAETEASNVSVSPDEIPSIGDLMIGRGNMYWYFQDLRNMIIRDRYATKETMNSITLSANRAFVN